MATQNFVKLILQLFPGLILICLTFLQQTNFLPTFYNLSKPNQTKVVVFSHHQILSDYIVDRM